MDFHQKSEIVWKGREAEEEACGEGGQFYHELFVANCSHSQAAKQPPPLST